MGRERENINDVKMAMC